MPTITEFVKWFNTESTEVTLASRFINAQLATEVAEHFNETYLAPRARTHIGMSELGKPAVLLALKKLGINHDENTIARKTNLFWGKVFESSIIALMRTQGMFVSHEQALIDYRGYPGHIDCVVDNTIVEVKTMSSGYFRIFSEKPNDDRGYMTQLALYAKCSGLKGKWLIFDKHAKQHEYNERCPLREIYTQEFLLLEALERVDSVIDALEHINSVSDIFEYLEAPQPVAEIYRKEPSGRYLVPESMRYSPFVDVFYDTVEEPNGYKSMTRYVVGFKNLYAATEELINMGVEV